MMLLGLLCSCEAITEVDDISNHEIILLAPAEGVIIDTTHVDFHWEAMKEATHYQLQIATPSFDKTIQIVIDTIVANHSFSTTLIDSLYEWRVRGINFGYKTDYSTTNFIIQAE